MQALAHGTEFGLQQQRLGHGRSQLVRALLQRGHLVGIARRDVILLGWILCDVIQLEGRG